MLSAAVAMTAVVCATSCQAQIRYNDVAIADAKGKVKAIYAVGKHSYNGRTWESENERYRFDESGRLIRYNDKFDLTEKNISRDSKERLTGFTCTLWFEDDESGETVGLVFCPTWEYDAEGNISKRIETSSKNREMFAYEYDSKGAVTSTIFLDETAEGGWNFKRSHTYTKFDDKGNWIERISTHVSRKPSRYDAESTTDTETRRIEYYE